MDTLRERIASFHDELTGIRRDIHSHPETGFEEVRTSALVAAKLREWGIDVAEKVGRTGVVGTIRGKRPGKASIGLRADMDALPIHEATGLPYASTTPGKMHACGHDGHTAMLLGAARHLAATRDFAGTVNVIFQPAEEGLGGALGMLGDGLFERFPCEAVYGMHNSPGLPVGTFAIREGEFMAASGRFEVTFTGRGGHAGMVDQAKYDLTSVLANFLISLQEIVARDVPKGEISVIRAGEIDAHGGVSLNVMPARIYVGGTMRCFSPSTQALFSRRIEEVAHQAVAAAEDASAEARLRWITTPLINAKEQTRVAVKAAGTVAGSSVNPSADPITGGEDFAFMMEARPGSFIFLGNGTPEDGRVHNVHTPKYDFNDRSIPFGVEYWVRLVQQELAG
jgi:hippurate hydrolase